MDIIPFIRFTLNTRFIMRWIFGGLVLYIPAVNFFSLGYLSKTSRLLMISSIGLPTWEKRTEIWAEGLRLIGILILYEAVPCFLFSFSFFLISLHSFTAFFGTFVKYLGFIALFICSFFVPFAFATYAEQMDFRKALEFEKIFRGIKEVLVPYAGGYIGTLIALGFFVKIIIGIPFLIGPIASSVLTYYTLLIATCFFTQLYTKTSLSTGRIPGEAKPNPS